MSDIGAARYAIGALVGERTVIGRGPNREVILECPRGHRATARPGRMPLSCRVCATEARHARGAAMRQRGRAFPTWAQKQTVEGTAQRCLGCGAFALWCRCGESATK